MKGEVEIWGRRNEGCPLLTRELKVRVQVIGHRVQAGMERGEARRQLQTKEEIHGGRSEASKGQR